MAACKEKTSLFLLVNFGLLFRKSVGDGRCGEWECLRSGAFCCVENPDMCCYHVWSLWWFWVFWLLIILLATSCGFWCRRRRLRNADSEYLIVQGPESVYGATVCNGTRDVSTGYASTAPPMSLKPPDYTDGRPPAYATIYAYPAHGAATFVQTTDSTLTTSATSPNQ